MSKRILMIEDNEDNRRIIRDLLASTDYELIEAQDGAAGLTMAATHKPDLILMDIQLPVIDGFEATQRLKADPALRHIPIVAVTSYALSGDDAKALAAGCDAYIAKPFSPRQLLSKVRELLACLYLLHRCQAHERFRRPNVSLKREEPCSHPGNLLRNPPALEPKP